MDFDDEEHRVKRILDDESKNSSNDEKGKKEDTEQSNNENIDADKKHDDSSSASKPDTSETSGTKNNESDSDDKHEELPLYDGDISESTPTNDTVNDADIKPNAPMSDDIKDNSRDGKAPNNKSDHNKSNDKKNEKQESDKTKDKTVNPKDADDKFIPPSQMKKEQEAVEEPMGLLDHLTELRRRLLRIVIIVLLGFIAFYGVSELAFSYLAQPAIDQLPEKNKSLIFTAPQTAFFIYLKVAFMLSIIGTSPFTFYQLWAFIAPGLYKEEQKVVAPLAFFSAFFFVSGSAFCYFLVLPIALEFFFSFESDMLMPMITIDAYFSLALKLIIAFGLVFEMPLFAYFFAKLRIISPEGMRKHRKYAVLAIFVVAAILTPPDVASQVLMAIPMLVLYEISIYVAKVARGKNKAKEIENESEEDTDDINDKINNFK